MYTPVFKKYIVKSIKAACVYRWILGVMDFCCVNINALCIYQFCSFNYLLIKNVSEMTQWANQIQC